MRTLVAVLLVATATTTVVMGDVCTITSSPNPIPTSMAPVTVSWQFDTSKWTPSVDDVMAIYTPSSSDDAGYIGYKLLSTAAGWSSGSGSLTFQLANQRADDYQFRIFNQLPVPTTPYVSDATNQLVHKYRHRLPQPHKVRAASLHPGGVAEGAVKSLKVSGPTRLCSSNSLTFENPNEPLQGHLTLTDDDTSLLLMFVTGDRTNTPTVRWGSASGDYPFAASGTSDTYARTDMCAAPANTTEAFRDPGMIHSVTLSNLVGGTRYYYQFGHEASNNWSPEFSVLMPIASGPNLDPSAETSVFAFGDLGETFTFDTPQEQYPNAIKTIQYILNEAAQDNESQPHYVLHIGDLSYARGYAYQWSYFGELTAPLATQYPYLVSIGNHEWDWLGQKFKPSNFDYGTDSGGECGVPYSKRFHMPTGGAQPHARNLWYSFNAGHIHFAIFSAEHDFWTNSEQHQWLTNDLASVDRSVTPWLVVASHRPWYSSSDPGTEEDLRLSLQANIEPLLLQYNVDVYLAGHVHAYERTCGVANNTCADRDEDAPVHLTIGMAGNDYMVPWIQNPDDPHRFPQPPWSVFRSLEFGYTHIRANATQFTVKYWVDQPRSAQVHDSLTLNK